MRLALARFRRGPRLRGLLACALACCLASAVAAQRSTLGLPAHGMLGAPRILADRLELADRVALGVVDAVDVGRIHVRDAAALVGEVGDRVAIKRAPSHPPPVEEGERVVLLLRGARSPYVLVDEPDEVVVLADAEAWRRWTRAVRELVEARGRPERLLALYVSWLDAEAQDLREEAVRALTATLALRPSMDREFLRERVRVATDPERSPAVRSASAFVATLTREGARMLLAHLPGPPGVARAEVLSAGLEAGLRLRLDATQDVLLRSLAHSEPEIRRTAARYARHFATTPEVHSALARLAGSEPDGEARALATRALRRAGDDR
jgi:hypothetical protein